MADSNRILDIIPIKNPTPEQVAAIENLKKFIENPDKMIRLDRSIDKLLREYREHAYGGGKRGITSDKKYGIKDVQNIQELIDYLKKIGFLKGELISKNGEYTGVYDERMYKEVRELQKSINEYLREKNGYVIVPPNKDEINLLKRVSKAQNLYNLKKPFKWKSEKTGLSYEINLVPGEIDGKKIGHIKVYDKDGTLLKDIAFRVDKDGNATISAVKLYQILVDGYYGIETNRAMQVFLKDLERLEKSMEEPITPVIPQKTGAVIELGYSFRRDLSVEDYWNMINRRLYKVDYNCNDPKIKEEIDTIKLVLTNLSYEGEEQLRRNPDYVKIDGKEYSLTWQGAMIARLDGIKYDKFLDLWIKRLKENPATKEVIEKVEKGEIKKMGKPQGFIIVSESTVSAEGDSNLNYGVSTAEIEQLYIDAIKNVEKVFSEPKEKEKNVWKNLIIKAIEREKEEVIARINEIKNNSKTKEEFLKNLNEDNELMDRIFKIYGTYGSVPGSANMFEVPAINLGLDEKKLNEYLEKAINENLVNARKLFTDNFSWLPFGIWSYDDASAKDIRDKFLDEYVVRQNDGLYINLSKIENPEMKAFAIYMYWKIYQFKKNENKMKNAMVTTEKITTANKV